MSIDFYSQPDGSVPRHGLVSRYNGEQSGPRIGGGVVHAAAAGRVGVVGSGLHGAHLLQRAARYRKWPGIFHAERAARGYVVCPAQADIADNSTLTFNDGTGDRVFEFDKDGSGLTVGDVLVDIQAAVTGADVADELFDAMLADWTGGGIDIRPYNRAGSAVVAFLQVNAHIPEGLGIHVDLTWGALGNNAIVASVPAEWAGAITGMAGGRDRLPGVTVVPGNVHPGRRWVPLGSYIDEMGGVG